MPLGHAEHVGSLLRPAEVGRALADADAGRLDRDEADGIIGEAAEDAIDRQVGLGLTSPTDGEYFRHDWFTDFHSRLGGVRSLGVSTYTFRSVLTGEDIEYHGEGFEATPQTRLDGVLFDTEARLVAAHDSGSITPKLTIPSPSLITVTPEAMTPEVRAAVIAAYVAEARGLAELGLRYLQLDDPWLINSALIPGLGAVNAYLLDQITDLIAAIHDAVPDLRVGVHLCRGNYGSGGIVEGGYEPIADRVFGLGADRVFLEFDDARSGTLDVLAAYDPTETDTEVALGLVSTKRAETEDPDELLRRIEEAARYVPAERLALSTQCGFASADTGANLLTEEQQWAKLANLTTTAERFWG